MFQCKLLKEFFSFNRKEGGKYGFAESIPNERITAFKTEQAPVDTNDVQEQAEEIIANAFPPPEVYLLLHCNRKSDGWPSMLRSILISFKKLLFQYSEKRK